MYMLQIFVCVWVITFISFKSGNLINEKQINSLLCPSPVQKCDASSYSEASTVDPVILEMFSQPKKSHLPKDCFAEGKNLLCIAVTPNELILKDICLEHFQIARNCLPKTLVYKHKNSNKYTWSQHRTRAGLGWMPEHRHLVPYEMPDSMQENCMKLAELSQKL